MQRYFYIYKVVYTLNTSRMNRKKIYSFKRKIFQAETEIFFIEVGHLSPGPTADGGHDVSHTDGLWVYKFYYLKDMFDFAML